MAIVEVTSVAQVETICERYSFTVVKFYATWCGPCREIAAPYESLVKMYDPLAMTFCACDGSAHSEVMERWGVTLFPTLLLFHHSQVLGPIQGRTTEQMLVSINALAEAAFSLQTGTPALHLPTRLLLAISKAGTSGDAAAEKQLNQKLYDLVEVVSSTASTRLPLGLALAPCLVSCHTAVCTGLSRYLTYLEENSPRHRSEAAIVVNILLRFVRDTFLGVTLSYPSLQPYYGILMSMIKCPKSRSYLPQSLFFSTPSVAHGSALEMDSVLGAVLGLSFTPRTPPMSSNDWFQVKAHQVVSFFNPTFFDQNPNALTSQAAEGRRMRDDTEAVGLREKKIAQIREEMNVTNKLNSDVFRMLIRATSSRDELLKFVSLALAVNRDMAKSMAVPIRTSSAVFMVHLCNALMQQESALPCESAGDPLPPASYFLQTEGFVCWPLEKETERIVHFDESNPLPLLPPQASPFTFRSHMFFATLWSVRMAYVPLIERHESEVRSRGYRDPTSFDTVYFRSEDCLTRALFGSKEASAIRVAFLENTSKWLLTIMKVAPDGTLPSEPPIEWQYLPQDVVYTVLTGIKHSYLDALSMSSIVSLMLVLMGNTKYFPKPHSHALLSDLLTRLRQRPATAAMLQQHPWFASHIVRACINCYIAVEKSTYERLEVRYHLSHTIKELLGYESLCSPVRAELEGSNSVLERLSHMVASEVNLAVNSVIETLQSMNNIVTEGGETGMYATAPEAAPGGETGQAATADQGPAAPAVSPTATTAPPAAAAADLEGASDTNESGSPTTQTFTQYHKLGLQLRSHIETFTVSIRMFSQLAITFPAGVGQNMVGQQVAQMLARCLVTFAGKDSRRLRIENGEQYSFHPRQILEDIVECFTEFARGRGFLKLMCDCGTPVSTLLEVMNRIVQRQLLRELFTMHLQAIIQRLETISERVGKEAALWDDAPDYALDALLSTPLLDPVAVPSEVKDLSDLVFVNRKTLHHVLLSESKNPFTKEYLDEKMLDEFNNRPEIAAAVAEIKTKVAEWLAQARASTNL